FRCAFIIMGQRNIVSIVGIKGDREADNLRDTIIQTGGFSIKGKTFFGTERLKQCVPILLGQQGMIGRLSELVITAGDRSMIFLCFWCSDCFGINRFCRLLIICIIWVVGMI